MYNGRCNRGLSLKKPISSASPAFHKKETFMAKILCIGIATLDIVNTVEQYPHEDDEIRILAQDKRRGGNASNTAVVLSQLGHQCSWAGTLVDEADSQTILDDLIFFQVNYQSCRILEHGKTPTSYIALSRKTGSRTICHFRDLPEYDFNDFIQISLEEFDWIHFEGRNVAQTHKMMHFVKQKHPKITISLEIEKNRPAIEQLFALADILMFSRHYALSQSFSDCQHFCEQKHRLLPEKTIFCAWGEAGAGAIINAHYYWQDAKLVKTIDTLGAGDVFNAAIIDQLIRQHTIKQSLQFGCQLAGIKCSKMGLNLQI
jgi:ketohexokinase